jgi:hypothetical protein
VAGYIRIQPDPPHPTPSVRPRSSAPQGLPPLAATRRRRGNRNASSRRCRKPACQKASGAADTDHVKLNANLGKADDKPTEVMFAFIEGALKKKK